MKSKTFWSAAIYRRFCAIAAILLATTFAWGAEPAVNPFGEATATPLKKAPVIDGKIEPGEWDGAVRTTGFQTIFNPGGFLDPRTGTSYFGFTQDRLYIAVVSEYPPDGKDHSSGTGRDKDYVFDESLEIWLDPNRDHRQSQQGDLRFYQMNGNARGGIYDVAFDPKKGPNTGWNGNWEYKSTVDHDKHVWTAELSLPFTDFGWKPGEVLGRSLGVMIARDFKGPWEQVTWFPVLGAFIDWYRYPVIHLVPDAPSVQVTSLGPQVHKGELQLRATITNPGPARKVKANLLVTSSDMPELKDAKELDLPAGGVAPYQFDVGGGRLHEDAQHTMTFDVTSADGKQTNLHYVLKWTKAPEKKWHYRIGPDPEAAVRFAYYPSYKFVRVSVDTRELGKDVEATSNKASVAIAGPDGKQVLRQAMTWDKAPAVQEFTMGDLADGVYKLTIAVDGWKEPFVRTFKRLHFPWEGNTLGVTDRVLPPFEPIKISGQKLAVVQRGYTINGLGLCDQVTSLGRPLLAAPMTLVADGQTSLAGRGRFTETRPNAAVYEGEAQHTAARVKSRCTTEYDGCTKVELTLEPVADGGELKSLWLDIPLVDKEMPLWHVSTSGLRINPAGNTPTGEGEVWDSRQFPDGNWYGNFKCYLWLGAEERGLCWFADNDRGWVLNVDQAKPEKSAPCQQLLRKAGVLTLRVNLVQKPITLTEPRTITFGLMASPGKPMKPDWRRIGISDISVFNMGYATPASYCAKAPWGNDFRIADWAYERRTGKPGPSKEDLEAWKERNFPKDMDPKFRQDAINLAVGPFLGSFRPGQKYYKMYFEEFHTTAQVQPESHVFQSEWTGGWHAPLLERATVQGHKMWGIGTGGIVASYRDFACWYAAQWVKRGIGIYFDNSYPLRSYDILTTNAYRLPDGQIQPSAGIWARREYLKRVWVIHRTMAPADALPAMMIHMTNTHILPYMVFNDENLDLEWKFGPEPQQSKFPYDFLRAESLGRQTGNVPWVLDKIMDTRSKEQERVAVRTRFGAMMVHEIRWWDVRKEDLDLYKILNEFGYGQDDCQVWNYWQADYPFRASDPEAKSLLLDNGKELMLLVCTWDPQPAKVVFSLDTAKLRLRPTSAVNAEKPDESLDYDAKAGKLTLDLEGYGVRLVRMCVGAGL